MTGLENIVNQIIAESEEAARRTLADAQARADKIRDDAQADAKQREKLIVAQAEADAAQILEGARSGADLIKRRSLLQARQQLIAQTLEKAKESFYAMDDDAYFRTICEMLGRYAYAQAGRLAFNQRDLDRLPAGFDAQVAQALAGKPGASLTLDEAPRDIDGGFVLIYGDIEENCSFEALFDAQKDRLQDEVRALLFG